jgi:iron complex transport system permease protein
VKADSRRRRRFAVLAAFSLAIVAVSPWIGMQWVGGAAFIRESAPLLHGVFWKLRVPRALVAFIAGGGLALGGVAFQALFRNPLAEPYILGVSSGASAGVSFALLFGAGTRVWGLSPVQAFSFAGAAISVAAVYGFSRLKRDFSPATLLLTGVALNFFFSSLVMLFQHLSDPHNAARIVRAMTGGLAAASYRTLGLSLPFVLAGGALVALCRRELDVFSFGEETALARGVDVPKVRMRVFLGTSLTVGGITALCGPIGFVGLTAPHICRLFVGPGHRLLLPSAVLFGGAFLAAADAAARIVVAPAELPAGVVTSLCGGPFFPWLLLRSPAWH